jgi:hypothetical protein
MRTESLFLLALLVIYYSRSLDIVRVMITGGTYINGRGTCRRLKQPRLCDTVVAGLRYQYRTPLQSPEDYVPAIRSMDQRLQCLSLYVIYVDVIITG